MAQVVDQLSSLVDRRAADTPVVAAAERHVLPDEHPGPVGGLVEGRVGDMTCHSHQIQAKFVGEVEVLSGRRLVYGGQAPIQWWHDRPAQIQALPVDPPDVVAHAHRPEADPSDSRVAYRPVLGGHGELQVEQGLVAEFARPPQWGTGHPNPPLQTVLAGGQRLGVPMVDAEHRGTEHHGPGSGRVNDGPHGQSGNRRGGVRAHHP